MTFFSKVVLTAILACGIYKPTRTHTVLHIKIKNIWLYCPHRDSQLLQKALPTQESFFIGFFKEEGGVPGGIRTHGPRIRNSVLYPSELREQAIKPFIPMSYGNGNCITPCMGGFSFSHSSPPVEGAHPPCVRPVLPGLLSGCGPCVCPPGVV